MYKVTISKAMNGYIAEVGCQTLVFETEGKLINELTRYMNNPDGVEKEYQELYGPKKNEPATPRGGEMAIGTNEAFRPRDVPEPTRGVNRAIDSDGDVRVSLASQSHLPDN